MLSVYGFVTARSCVHATMTSVGLSVVESMEL